jgi:hypothetical protein
MENIKPITMRRFWILVIFGTACGIALYVIEPNIVAWSWKFWCNTYINKPGPGP